MGDFSISHTVCRIRCHFSYSHIYVGSVVFKNWLIRILKQRYVDLTSSLVQYWVMKHNRSKLALQNREKQIITHNVNKRITRILCIHHQDLFALVGLRFDHQDQGRVYSVWMGPRSGSLFSSLTIFTGKKSHFFVSIWVCCWTGVGVFDCSHYNKIPY